MSDIKPNQVWQSPKGHTWRVMSVDGPFVHLRQHADGTGRKQTVVRELMERNWKHVPEEGVLF